MYPDPDYATALSRAFNDWLADTWLSAYNADGCFRGSLNVAQQDPQAAAAEIERIGGHEYMVQVMVDSGARAPLGQRQYHPIYEQCEKLGLPFAIHPGTDGAGINAAPTPGYPTHLVEWHTLLSLGFQAHLVSFITEGVFERYPRFMVVVAIRHADYADCMHVHACSNVVGMRTTIELPDNLRQRVVAEAAARNLRGYSQVIEDALRAYFDGRQDDRRNVVARIRGSLGAQAAAAEHRRLAEVRANWRT